MGIPVSRRTENLQGLDLSWQTHIFEAPSVFEDQKKDWDLARFVGESKRWVCRETFLLRKPNQTFRDGKPIGWKDSGDFYAVAQKTLGTWQMARDLLILKYDDPTREFYVMKETLNERWIDLDREISLHLIEPKTKPDWFHPAMRIRDIESMSISEKCFECAICCFSLWMLQPAAVLRFCGKRVCEHYFHHACAVLILQRGDGKGVCPICTSKFEDVKEVPDLKEDSYHWFQICDSDFTETLNIIEIENCLGAVFPIDRKRLRNAIYKNWRFWDTDNSGCITIEEFVKEPGGLRRYIIDNLDRLVIENMREERLKVGETPKPEDDAKAWFGYWDSDNSGTLERHEVIRGLTRAYCLSKRGEILVDVACELTARIHGIWASLGFRENSSVTYKEFVEKDGLLDLIRLGKEWIVEEEI